MNSTRIGEVSLLKADQDHDYLLKEQEKEEGEGSFLENVDIGDVGEEDIITLRTQIVSLQMDLKSDTKKKLLEAEARCKKLGQKLCEFEAVANSNSDSYEVIYMQANDQLTQKTKKIKDIESALRKSEKHVKELNEQIASSSIKITELDNANSRLKIMSNQAATDLKKNSPRNEPSRKCDSDGAAGKSASLSNRSDKRSSFESARQVEKKSR